MGSAQPLTVATLVTGQQFEDCYDGLPMPICWNMLTGEPDAVGQGTWGQAIGLYSYRGIFANGAGAADLDNFTVNFRCPAGTYTVRITAPKIANSAVMDVDIDGGEIGSIDLNAGDPDFVFSDAGNVLAAGAHTLRIRVDGRTGAGWQIQVSEIELIRTA